MRLSPLYVFFTLALIASSAPLNADENVQFEGSLCSTLADETILGDQIVLGGTGPCKPQTTVPLPISVTKSAPAVASASMCPPLHAIVPQGEAHVAAVTHPLGKSKVTLFHGTDVPSAAEELKGKIDISKIRNGDLHGDGVPEVQGGFYLTDSLLGAAQFGCRNLLPPAESEEKVYVLEYTWDGANRPVEDFKDDPKFKEFLDYDKTKGNTKRDQKLDAIMIKNDMISGPMKSKGADDLLSLDFWQYAIIKQKALDDSLKYVTTHEVICSAVPPGNGVRDVLYSAGQKAHPMFDQILNSVTTCLGKNDWKKAHDEIPDIVG